MIALLAANSGMTCTRSASRSRRRCCNDHHGSRAGSADRRAPATSYAARTTAAPIWEASPSPLHQLFVRDIEASIRASNESGDGRVCEHIADAYIRLPDSSLVRPDIAIFCAPIPRQREAYAAVPAAVIEIVSPNYEANDYEELPPIYLANGVRDVVVVDPEQSVFTHYRPGHPRSIQQLPHQLYLECGYLVQLPA